MQAYNALSPILLAEDPGSVLRRKAIMLELVRGAGCAAGKQAGDSHDAHPMVPVVARLNSGYRRNWRVGELARECGLSISHFRRLFHDYTGRSPHEFILALRMAEAKRLLREGVPIKQTASLVGYADVFYFMRVFRLATGLSPGRFQKRNGLQDG